MDTQSHDGSTLGNLFMIKILHPNSHIFLISIALRLITLTLDHHKTLNNAIQS